jgi:DivIVA domain-containing protein
MLSSSENAFGFSSSKRGYEVSEVDAYIDRLRREHAEQLEFLEGKVNSLESELSVAREKEEAVHLTLLAATKTKDELLGAAQRQLDEATSSAKEEADKILADARYEAFKTLTDTTEEAEQALREANAQAQSLVTEARAEAETTLTEARREAISIITDIKKEGERLIAEREEQLADMDRLHKEEHGELINKVETYRRVATDLEARLKAIARGAVEEIAAAGSLITAEIEGELIKLSRQTHRAVDSSDAADPGEEVPRERGSYYRRKSASLPRLGEESTSSVSAAIRALRSRPEEAATQESDDVPDPDDDVAIELVGQSA